MRPPEFTGGNRIIRFDPEKGTFRFNEAAGIHRRKHDQHLKEREDMLQLQ